MCTKFENTTQVNALMLTRSLSTRTGGYFTGGSDRVRAIWSPQLETTRFSRADPITPPLSALTCHDCLVTCKHYWPCLLVSTS